MIRYNKYEEEGEWKVCVRENDEIINIHIFNNEDEASKYIKSEVHKTNSTMSNKNERNERKNEVNKTREALGDTLDGLLSDDSLLEDSADKEHGLPQITSTTRHDYATIKGNTVSKAKKTITSLMKFYLDEKIIENNEYVQARKKIDEMTLGSLMFQLDTAEKALVTLLKTIDSGETAPRMFEVLGTLQKSMLDIIKSQTMYLVAAEESVKKLSRDIDVFSEKKKKSSGDETNNEISNINRGTKGLMQSIQEDVKNFKDEGDDEEYEDINIEDVE